MSSVFATCPSCSSGGLSVKTVTLEGERYDEKFAVSVQGLACDECDYQTISNSQSSEFTKALSDAYRNKYGRLTGDEIKARREQLGMNQMEFAEYLGVGSSSLKRWESGQVQEKAMDELIRLKTEPNRARKNYESLENRLSDVSAASNVFFSGMEIDLSTRAGQTYYRAKKCMKVDMSQIEMDGQLIDYQEPVAA